MDGGWSAIITRSNHLVFLFGDIVTESEVARGTRRLRVKHTTRYTYDAPITRSVHKIHLRPIHDWKQHVISYKLTVSPAAKVVEFEDTFGNFAARFDMSTPYQELTIAAESVVEVIDIDPFSFQQYEIRPSIPVGWMPWETTMLQPYLTTVELPDTQIKELLDYANSFAKKNSYDVLETLFAINLSLFRDYHYTPGSTSLETTPFDVYLTKRGVCQDFANLFICLARLLGVPARYVCGYVYTGNTGISRALCDASHAWVQIYIPDIGWKAFDPTNGILPTIDHVRVGVGRHYRDTAPTSGTYYSPAYETMHVDVEVTDVTDGESHREDSKGSKDREEHSGKKLRV
jgi:transglutaminase-like putative cysteine protease